MGVSPPSQPSSLDTQQQAYQQAFLQNAVAQNMQIQQQLMLQNQALTQLLSQSSTAGPTGTSGTANSSISTIMGTPSLPSMIPMAQYQQMQQQQQQTEQTLLMAADASRKISAGDVLDGKKAHPMADFGKQRSLSTPNTPKQVEAFQHYHQNPDGTLIPNPMVSNKWSCKMFWHCTIGK